MKPPAWARHILALVKLEFERMDKYFMRAPLTPEAQRLIRLLQRYRANVSDWYSAMIAHAVLLDRRIQELMRKLNAPNRGRRRVWRVRAHYAYVSINRLLAVVENIHTNVWFKVDELDANKHYLRL